MHVGGFIDVKWHPRVASSYPSLVIVVARFVDVNAEKRFDEIEKLEVEVFEDIKRKYTLESLKNDPIIRAYRDFYWRLSIDPTKQRPASEALIRRVLGGGNIWRVNKFVNAYNLASAMTGITLGAYDMGKIRGGLVVRFAEPGELFQGIGMPAPKPLNGNEVVVSDHEGIISIYPHRDSERTKVTEDTREALLIAYGVPGVPVSLLEEAVKATDKVARATLAGRLESYFVSKPHT